GQRDDALAQLARRGLDRRRRVVEVVRQPGRELAQRRQLLPRLLEARPLPPAPAPAGLGPPARDPGRPAVPPAAPREPGCAAASRGTARRRARGSALASPPGRSPRRSSSARTAACR